MALWVKDLIAVGVLLILAPAVAWIARRHGKRLRGNLIMA